MDESERGSEANPWAVLIIGAGFGGLGMAIELGRAGEHDVLLLEKGGDVGGVWRENTYPGAACDVPSHLYSFSFEPNPDWSRTYSPQAEILDYLRRCADKYGVRDKIRFGCEVTAAAFDEATSLWRVALARRAGPRACGSRARAGERGGPAEPAGDSRAARARHLPRPGLPLGAMAARRRAEGQARRRDRHRRVGDPVRARDRARGRAADRVPAHAVRGSCRAPIAPTTDRERRRFARWPWLMAAHRALIYAAHDSRAVGFTRLRWMMDIVGGLPARKLLKQQVPDAALRDRLTPRYPIGCKRVLVSNDWLPTFSRPNVELVTDAIERRHARGRARGGRARDRGRRHRAGHRLRGQRVPRADDDPRPRRTQPQRGLGERRAGLAGHHRAGLPELLHAVRPQHQPGPQLDRVHAGEPGRARDALPAPAARRARRDHRGRRRRRSSATTRACSSARSRRCSPAARSWYVDADGRHTVNWPGFTTTYRWLTRHAGLSAYVVR